VNSSTPEAETGVPAPRGRWEFNTAVAEKFDEHVRKSVPDYEAIQFTAAALCDWFAPAGGTVMDFGCATGQTLGMIAGTNAGKSLRLVGYDGSEAMITKAQNMRAKGITWQQGWLPGCLEIGRDQPINFALFLYTLQFLTPEDRARTLKAAADRLAPGGALFVVEKVFGSTPAFHDLTSQLYAEMKLTNGLTPDEVQAKARSLRGVMHPLTVAENEAAFRAAGLTRHELIYRRLSFAGWIVTK
jgi:tRNA (cmo5U34)-methyltransferase